MRKRSNGRIVASCTEKGIVTRLDYSLLVADVKATLAASRKHEKPHESFARLLGEARLCRDAGALGHAIRLYEEALDVLIDADYVNLTSDFEEQALDVSTEADKVWKRLIPGKRYTSERYNVRLAYLDIRYTRWGFY